VNITSRSNNSAEAFAGDEDRWRAVARRSQDADGQFVYSVRTTGVYCRPSCAARLARRENVQFHLTAADAEKAGFRACKRCRPNGISFGNEQAAAVAKACDLIAKADEPPDLETLAGMIGMSPSHLHRMFKSLTGVTPKAYATAHRAQRVRKELARSESVTSAIYRAGFNSNARFYANSSRLLGMKPKNFRAGGQGTVIRFAVGECSLGSILVAASKVGICAITLGDDPNTLVEEFQKRFPKAELIGGDKAFEQLVAKVIEFVERPAAGCKLPLDIQGTAFQQRVWQKLCEIPCGETRSYSEIARELGVPNSTRAVASAIASNRIAVAIPCHRVIRTGGALSGYRWGVDRKARLLKSERGE